MARFGRTFGNEYDRDFGPRRDWGEPTDRWGQGTGYQGGWRGGDRGFGGYYGGDRYDRGFRNIPGTGYDRSYRTFVPTGYDRGFRGNQWGNQGSWGGYPGSWNDQGSWNREPFPVRPSTSSHPMTGRGSGYDRGYFGEEYDRPMRGGQRNFGDFRNSYLGPWF